MNNWIDKYFVPITFLATLASVWFFISLVRGIHENNCKEVAQKVHKNYYTTSRGICMLEYKDGIFLPVENFKVIL